MPEFNFTTNQIESQFLEAEKVLLNPANIVVISYRDFDHETFDELNEDLLKLIGTRAMVYCIWCETENGDLAARYIGHAYKISRQRVRAHFTKRNEHTGSKLPLIQIELQNRRRIGFSFLLIEPFFIRKALEEWLIDRNSGTLEWNTVGRRQE